MAAFLTHLVVGERVWTALDGWQACRDNYGTFLFGCLAPDVDKLCAGLDQGTTHFVPKDADNSHLWRRSQRFLDNPIDFLRAPFVTLEPEEQAFVLGYLCHVATDEITARHAHIVRARSTAVGEPLPSVDAILTSMEPRIWGGARDPEAVSAALEGATIPDGTLTFVPLACLLAMHQIVLSQVREGGGLLPYLNMVRRQWQWMRHGRVSDSTGDPDLEAELLTYRRQMEAGLPAAERLMETMDLAAFVKEAAQHSWQQIQGLQQGRWHSEPSRL